MRIGALRHKVLVQSFSGAKDTAGHYDKDNDTNWTTDATGTVWGSIEPLSGEELEHARQLVATATHKVTIRYLADLTPDKRIKFGTRIFAVEAPPINIDEGNHTLELLCTERV
jgi:SPP1 family predicted phage head-tail adaptor